MLKAYSLALRERVACFVDAGHFLRAAAAHFGVSVSFAVNLMRVWRMPDLSWRTLYTHDFARSPRASLGYTDLGDLPYASDVDPTVRDQLTLRLSLHVHFNDDVNLGFDYRTSFGGSGNRDHTFGAKLGLPSNRDAMWHGKSVNG